MTYDEQFTRLLKRFGPAVVEPWRERLPALLTQLTDAWRVELGAPVGRGNTSLVIHCHRDGRAGILKLSPDLTLADAEIRALASWAPSGRVPQVWEADARRGAFLMEAIPEHPLRDIGLGEIAELINALHERPAPPNFQLLSAHVDFIFGYWSRRAPEQADWLTHGWEIARGLTATPAPRSVLVHGDLHKGNLLDAGPRRGLVAIDPRAALGDPAFDGADWVFHGAIDPGTWEPRAHELAERIDVPFDRLWGWFRAFAPMLARHVDERQREALYKASCW